MSSNGPVLASIVLLLLPSGCVGAGAPSPSVALPAGASARGERLYALYCSTCHGRSGDGAGPTAPRHGHPLPRDFTKGMFRFRSTASGQLPLHSDLVRTVTYGLPGTTMPAWGRVLGPRDVDAVVRFVEGFSPRFAEEPETEREVVPIPVTPPPTKEAVGRGRFVFLLMKCWECHGSGGRGDGPSAPTLKNDAGHPIRATDLARGLFKGGRAAYDVYRTVVTGLDGSPMPSYLDSTFVVREAGEGLAAAGLVLRSGEADSLRRWLSAQPALADWEAMGDRDRARLSESWRWDLVHYVRSLSDGRNGWRRFLGLWPI